MSDIITSAELKLRLGESSTDFDTLFAAYISDISEAVQSYIGTPLITPSAAVTVTLDGNGKAIMDLPNWPLLTTPALVVVEDDETLVEGNEEDFVVYPEQGYLKRISAVWSRGVQNISVAYKYGYAVASVPAPIKLVCYREIARLWNEQKAKNYGESSRSFESGSTSVFETGMFMKSSLEVLDRYRRFHL